MRDETWESLISDIRSQVSRGFVSHILVPDWKSFKQKVEESEYEINYKLYDKRSAFMYDADHAFEVYQSLLDSDYAIGSFEQGYGFKDLECMDCGASMDSLFYDSTQGEWYCPCN